MTLSYLELDRRFVPFHVGPTGLHVQAFQEMAGALERGGSWEEILLASPYVVILGEAGTGKTTEFRLQPKRLRSEGRSAFFMDITALARDGLRLSVPSDDLPSLDRWLESDSLATLFLDSVDEAELKHESLDSALRRLASDLGDARGRVRLVVSCRVSDWDSERGHASIREFARASGQGSSNIGVFTMARLDESRVERLAAHHGLDDPTRFIRSVKEAAAWPFVDRLLDVELMVGYWADHGEDLGGLTELVEWSLSQRIRERRPKSCPPSELSPAKAREGLMRLAGIAVLSGRWSFLIPGEALGGAASQDTIDPQEALDDWSPAEIRELLTRAVFDESTYGRVRLHHRVVQEYLAGRWLESKRKAGLRLRELRRLVLRDVGELSVVPEHLAACTSWLASWDADVLELLLEHAPAALLAYGDPASLTESARMRALESYLREYSSSRVERLFDHFDEATLRRFAPALKVTIADLLDRQDLPQEAIALLLQISALGQLSAARDAALSWAGRHDADPMVRRRAFGAVQVLAEPPDQRNLVVALLAGTGQWSQDVAGAFADCFFPDMMTPSQLGQLLRAAEPTWPGNYTSLKIFLSHALPQACPAPLRPAVLKEILASVEVTTNDRGWLLAGLQDLAQVCVEALDSQVPPGSELQEALLKLREEADVPFDGSAHRDRLTAVIAEKPGVRRWLFWVRAGEFRARKNGEWPVRHFHLYHHNDLASLSLADASWLAVDACQRTEPEARALAFDCLLAMGRESEELSGLVERLAEDDQSLARQLQLGKQRRNTPVPQDPHIAELEAERAERARKWEEQRLKNIRVLTEDIERIRSGTRHIDFLYNNGRDSSSEIGSISLGKVTELFGEDIADAFGSGLRAVWRSYSPPYRFENNGNGTKSTHCGLAGLGFEFAEGLDAEGLTDYETRVATRYATLELIRFPRWLDELARVSPDLVAAELSIVLEGDMRLPAGERTEILHKHRGLPEPVRAPLALKALALLETLDVTNSESLEYSLRICEWLLADQSPRLAGLCESKLREPLSLEHAASWWRAWAWAEPSAAVGFLEEFASAAEPAVFDEVVEALASCLASWGDAPSPAASALFGCTEALERLVPLVYSSIRPDEDRRYDPENDGIVDARGHAERFRGHLFEALVGTGDVAALQRVAEDPRMAEFRDVLLRNARQAPQRSLLARPMFPSEAMRWDRSHAMPIAVASELHQVVMDRLDDMKDYVERGESSVRELFSSADEKKFQPWLKERLEELSRRHGHGYAVHREEEADRMKLPDVRLYHSACVAHPVSIEVKVAENWSGRGLLEALEDQLVGRYLRAAKSRHGILLLCSRGKRKKWQLGGKKRDLEGARAFLQAEADRIVHGSVDIDALEVVTIDFH